MTIRSLIDPPALYLLFALLVILILIICFRRQIASLIARLTFVDVNLSRGKGTQITLRASEAHARQSATNDSDKPTPLGIPYRAYSEFVGRRSELGRAVSTLRDPTGMSIIAIYGLGGMGKTALVLEAITRTQSTGWDAVVWLSAKNDEFLGERVKERRPDEITPTSVFDAIAAACGRTDIVKSLSEQKKEALSQVLARKRVLVVLDNLDTIHQAEAIVESMFPILGKSKCILTSRHRLKTDKVFEINLSGLPDHEGLAFIESQAALRGLESLEHADGPTLSRIQEVTGGAPLAIKLVVGQMARQPVESVLEALQHANTSGQDYDFYRFIYLESWQLIGKTARKVLVSMSAFAPNIGGTESAVRRVCRVSSHSLRAAMEQLVLLSLVDLVSQRGTQRYSLHSLTHYFILSEIVRLWE